jgi:hypothetical protein
MELEYSPVSTNNKTQKSQKESRKSKKYTGSRKSGGNATAMAE